MACGADVRQIRIPFPIFRHIDFSTIAPELNGWVCEQCDLLQQLEKFSQEQAFYRSQAYGESAQTAHKFNETREHSRTRSAIQANYLATLLSFDATACLDIGCFDGAFLRALNVVKPLVKSIGYDVNPAHNVIDGEQRLEITDNEDKIYCRHYDAVVFSHSIMYIEDILERLKKLKACLTDKGFLFIQLPDIRANPLYALMGDQAFVFSEKSLRRMLGRVGYVCERGDLAEFPRELVLVARPTTCPVFVSNDASTKPDSVSFWEQLSKEIDDLSSEVRETLGQSKVYILGTTIFAAFVHELFPSHVLGFVDENYQKLTGKFRGMPVCHPDTIEADQNIYVGPDSGGTLAAKLNRRYPARFFSTATKSN